MCPQRVDIGQGQELRAALDRCRPHHRCNAQRARRLSRRSKSASCPPSSARRYAFLPSLLIRCDAAACWESIPCTGRWRSRHIASHAHFHQHFRVNAACRQGRFPLLFQRVAIASARCLGPANRLPTRLCMRAQLQGLRTLKQKKSGQLVDALLNFPATCT